MLRDWHFPPTYFFLHSKKTTVGMQQTGLKKVKAKISQNFNLKEKFPHLFLVFVV